jgi:hypothetical protein
MLTIVLCTCLSPSLFCPDCSTQLDVGAVEQLVESSCRGQVVVLLRFAAGIAVVFVLRVVVCRAVRPLCKIGRISTILLNF